MGNNIRNFVVVTSYYFKNYYRSKSFYLMLIISLLVSGLMTYFSLRYIDSLPQLFPRFNFSGLGNGTKEMIFGYLWAFVLLDLPVFAAVFFGSSAVSSEIENKTAFHIFPLPIGRGNLLISKYIAAVAVTALTVMVYVVIQAAVFVYLFHGLLIIAFFQSVGLLMIFIFSIMAFTFLISSIFNRNTYAYITVFLIYFLIFNASGIIIEFLYKSSPFYLLNISAQIIDQVYIDISASPFSNSFSLAPAGMGEIIRSVAVMIIYGVISISTALIIFDRKEVK